jgi:hypothetical protein
MAGAIEKSAVSVGTGFAMRDGMRIRIPLALPFALTVALAGCEDPAGTRGTDTTTPDVDMSFASDMARPGPVDTGDMQRPGAGDDNPDAFVRPDGFVGNLPDGGSFGGGGGDMGTVAHAPPGTLAGVVVLGAGTDFRDVSSDQGGGTWAVTSAAAYYWPKGATSPVTYNQGNGLARGKSTWDDEYWCLDGTNTSCHVTNAVSFSAVAGGMPGQAVIGNIGYIADKLQVDPSTGAVQSVEGYQVTSAQQPNPDELKAQQQRVVATWRAIVDLNGVFNGTAYIGGFHGTSAIHALQGGCGCMDFEEHVHPFFNGNTQTAGGDVRGYALTPQGDVWVGDRDVVALYLARSRGPNANLEETWQASLDVFPGRKDEVWGLGVDASGGVWVASYGNGAAYLAPGTYAPTYYGLADKLPSNYLTGVAVDKLGDVWFATFNAGVVRYTPGANAWTYYTSASGLPSNDIRNIYSDRNASGRAIYIATGSGVAVYTGP